MKASEVFVRLESITSANSKDSDSFYEALEALSFEVSDDITTLVHSSLDVNEDPAQVLSSYCLKIAFEYAAEEVRGILHEAMSKKDVASIIDCLQEALAHNIEMAEDEMKAIIDMIN